MAIVVNTNLASMMAQKNLSNANVSLNTSIERLSTGLKINKAADDSAGLSIASNLNTQIRGSQVAQSNIQQGINLLQTGEGDLNSIADNISRIRDLAVQASNGINSSDAKASIIKEVKARVAEMDKTAGGSQFNGVKLFDGALTLGKGVSADGMRLQVGANADTTTNSIVVDKSVFQNAAATAIGLLTQGTATDTTINTAFATASAASAFITNCDTALKNISGRTSDIGAYQNRLQSNFDSLNVVIENMSAAKSTIMDTDVAKESANLTKANILQQVSTSLLAQANQTPGIALSLI